MPARFPALIPALALTAIPAVAAAKGPDHPSQINIRPNTLTQGHPQTGGQAYGDRNRGGRSGFYSYPRHRHVDSHIGGTLDRAFSELDPGTSPYSANTHGSAYYGRDYGAPYFGGGYYDRGTYYRERRER